MSIERFPGVMSEIVRKMFVAVETNDVDKTVSFFSKDAFYKVANNDPVYGHQGIKDLAGPVMQMFKKVSHEIKAMWELGGDTVVCEMVLSYTRQDDKVFKLPCCDTIRFDDNNLIRELRAYLDLNPLFAKDEEPVDTQSNLEFIKGLYAAFKRGEIQPWLDAMTEESTWELIGPTEIPLCGLRKGKKQILDFLQTLVTTLEVKNSVQHKFIAEGDTIIVLGYVHSMVKATSIDFKSDYVHILTVKNGVLLSYREFLDNAQLLAAYKGR
ncbi:nuclear transport factor 2 family protein [Argonema antarcticum]|uniref:nuclear transport factor 2 family protein n=1 Tax=Argonema antarcticum TaxID=2942763 RepID=UPI0020134B35|nr:nuclear transport factor 2 family protein [Argonema antarcticum]MCL1470591.1 nuclear transport factor 2 family protein [Argonema antarcticum A004/B2]